MLLLKRILSFICFNNEAWLCYFALHFGMAIASLEHTWVLFSLFVNIGEVDSISLVISQWSRPFRLVQSVPPGDVN